MTSEISSAPELIYYCEFDRIEKSLEITYSNKHVISLEVKNNAVFLDIRDVIGKESSNIPKDFFGKNIVNITAVVGKNGVGKTGIFRNIFGFWRSDNFLIIFKENDRYIIENQSLFEIKNDKDNFVVCNRRGDGKFQGHISCKPSITLCFPKDFLENDEGRKLLSHNYQRKKLSQKDSQIYKTLTKDNDLFKKYFKLFPGNFVYTFLLDGNQLPILSIDTDDKEIQSAYENIRRLYDKDEVEKNQSKLLLLLYLLNIFLDQKLSVNFSEESYLRDIIFRSIINTIKEARVIDESLILEIINILGDVTINVNNNGVTETKKIQACYEDLVRDLFLDKNYHHYSVCGRMFLSVSLDSWNTEICSFVCLMEAIISKKLKSIGVVKLSFGEFSAGETELLHTLVSFKSLLTNENYGVKTIILFIDEYEKHLHPEWLRMYLKGLLNVLSVEENSYEFAENINIQLVINTHSPYLISDLPKENIRLIQKDEKIGKRTVLIPKHGFASNYYDILSDSFFLEDTIGEFAKQKINSWITELNKLKKNKLKIFLDDNQQKIRKINEIKELISLDVSNKVFIGTVQKKLLRVAEIKELINIVDDQFIRNKLLELAEDVRTHILKKSENSKISRIKLIDQEIERLEAMKQQLREESEK